MISKIKKPVSILLSLIMVFSMFAIVPLSASAAYWYSDLARGTLIQPGDTFSFEEIGSFKFADYNDPTIIHEVKGSDFSYNQATLSVTDGYYSFGSTKLLPTSVSPGGLLIADYDSTTKMATFGVQNITHSFDETTGTLTIGGTGVVPPNYAFTGSDVYGVVFTQSNLVKHLIIDATDMIAIKQDAFMAYTGGCVLEDVEINSTSSTPLIIEENAVFYRSGNTVTLTVNAVKLATVTNSPVGNYSSPVNLIYNVEQPITFNKNALTNPWRDLTVTFPAGCKIFIPGGPQFTDSRLQEEYDRDAEYGDEEFFWRHHSDLVEGTDYVLGDARYEELTPLNASLVVGNNNTALFSAYTITDESVNGTVTASVNGTDVTEAAADADVLLTVAPAEGYQFVSISAGDVALTTVTEGSQYSFTMPAKNVTVTAEFEEVAPTYTVTWKNWDGSVLKTDENVAEGATPSYDGTTPEKAEDENYTYTFAGWSPEVAAVTGDVTYTAVFTKCKTVSYREASWDSDNKKVVYTDKTAENAVVLDANSKKWEGGKTYVADGNVTINAWIPLTGDVKLILLDGATLTVSGRIQVEPDDSLEIYAQEAGTGRLNANSGIGGQSNQGAQTPNNNGGTISIHGGVINVGASAYGGSLGAGVYGAAGTVNIYGGKITATGNNNGGAGIGGGVGSPANLKQDSFVNIYGGNVTATGRGGGAGIGGGSNWYTNCTGADVKILGGTVVATGQIGIGAGKNNSTHKTLEIGENAFVYKSNVTVYDETTNDQLYANGPSENVEDRYTTMKVVYLHSVIIDENIQNGTVTVDKSRVGEGETVKITVNPDQGYELDTLTVKDENNKDVAVDSSNRISMPAGGVTVSATFKPLKYTVTWKNWNGDELYVDPTVPFGETPTYPYENPTRPEDDANTYTFSNWDPDVQPVTGPAEYKATYTAGPKPHTHGGIAFDPWTSTNSLPTTAGNYYLENDVTLSGTWTVPGGTTNLCLNGHGIIRTGSGRVIDLSSSGRNLNIYDCDTETEHKFTVSNPTANGAGVAVVNDNLTENYQTFKGGYITGGNAVNGAGIHVNYATFRLYGGTVIGNSNTGDGGGIYAEHGGSVYIDGGTVSYNQARQGGGIFAPNLPALATIHLNSGKVEKNYATYTGGGVYGGAGVPIYLQGSIVVTENYSVNAAGITASWNQSSARFYVSGSPYVYDNFNANGQSNVSGAYYEYTMQVTGNLGSDCKVGLAGANGLLNYYKSGYSHTEIDPNVLFPYDNNNYILVKNGNNAKRIPLYTITFKNYDDEVLQTSKVISGETPEYNGATPTKPADDTNTYTFAGWKNGTTTYAPGATLPEVTGDTTYTAQFTSKPKTLIAGHSLSLDGNIGINFYLDPSVAGLTAQQVNGDNLSYTFAWADVETTKAKVNVAEQANQKKFSIEKINGVDYIKVTCYVCAAEMTCDVDATFTLDGITESKTESETYSVRKYCDDSVLSENAQYKDDTKLVELVKAMLNYGAMAQTKFKVNTGFLANQNVTYEKGDVTGTMIDTAIAAANGNKTADNMNNVAAALGAKWFSTSLIYLDDSTLRHYFVKDTNAFNPSDYTGNKSNYYYYVEKTGIPAAELDNLQTFMESNTEKTFKYSPLDFVKGMIEYSADEDSVKLAKSLYWYNQAANKYFA